MSGKRYLRLGDPAEKSRAASLLRPDGPTEIFGKSSIPPGTGSLSRRACPAAQGEKALPDSRSGAPEVGIFYQRLPDREQNARTGLGMGRGVVMVQRQSQVGANVRQSGGMEAPSMSGQQHRAFEGYRGHGQPRRFTTRAQDGAIEPGIVRRQERGPLQQLTELGPGLPEGGLVGHVAPGDAVKVGELKITARGR